MVLQYINKLWKNRSNLKIILYELTLVTTLVLSDPILQGSESTQQ